MDIRNIAIIAHVDHGKTTLVDAILKQTHTFRDNQAEMQQTTILDRNELERERGITILAKNTAVNYKGTKINIVDTPGHADFGGEVERVLNMADGALLLVDAAEGPLPQTSFVLKKALEAKLKIIVVVNKVDRADARADEVLSETEELFLRLVEDPTHLDFPVVYTIGREGRAGVTPSMLEHDLTPLFETIIRHVPAGEHDTDGIAKMLVSTLDFDTHLGKLAIGKLSSGKISQGQSLLIVDESGKKKQFRCEKLFVNEGLGRVPVDSVLAGEIVTVAGISEIQIGQTITDPSDPTPLPGIKVEDPTMKLTVGPNSSPLAGREGKYVTSRQVGERLLKEQETNLGMKVFDLGGGLYEVAGRGELHLAVLLETMRREGYELSASQPQVIIKNHQEPYEDVTIDVADEYVGAVTTEMGRRKAEMISMNSDNKGTTRIVYSASQRSMIGVRTALLSATRGTALVHSIFSGYKELGQPLDRLRGGALISMDTGKSTGYALENLQERGKLVVSAGEDVYEGMVVGFNSREDEMDVNPCKTKGLSNVRAANKEAYVKMDAAWKPSLEEYLDIISDDELLEITPLNLRLRKKVLNKTERIRTNRRSG